MMPKSDEFSPKPELKPGKYRHYKGGEYKVLMLACDEATHEWLVIYEALYDYPGAPKIWARPHRSFTEKVKVGDELLPRFTRCSDEDMK
jgi:hypothetical protein